MLATAAHDALALAHDHARRLRDETAAERLSPPPARRRALAASLRRIADRVDPAPLAARAA